MKVSLVMFTIAGERRDFPLTRPISIVGRMMDCDLRVPVPSVSRNHLQFERRPDGLFAKDLESSNGTYVNNRRIRGEVELKAGDLVSAGPVHFTVVVAGEPKEFAQIRSVLPKTADVQSREQIEASKAGTQLDALQSSSAESPAAAAGTLAGYSVGEPKPSSAAEQVRAASSATVDEDAPDEDIVAIMSGGDEQPSDDDAADLAMAAAVTDVGPPQVDPDEATVIDTKPGSPKATDPSDAQDLDAPPVSDTYVSESAEQDDSAGEPVVETPTEEPAAEQPAAEQPAARQPSAEEQEPIARGPVTGSPFEDEYSDEDVPEVELEPELQLEQEPQVEPGRVEAAPKAPSATDNVAVVNLGNDDDMEEDLEAKLSMTGSGLLKMDDADKGSESDVAISAVGNIDPPADDPKPAPAPKQAPKPKTESRPAPPPRKPAPSPPQKPAAPPAQSGPVDDDPANALDALADNLGGGEEEASDSDAFAWMYDDD